MELMYSREKSTASLGRKVKSFCSLLWEPLFIKIHKKKGITELFHLRVRGSRTATRQALNHDWLSCWYSVLKWTENTETRSWDRESTPGTMTKLSCEMWKCNMVNVDIEVPWFESAINRTPGINRSSEHLSRESRLSLHVLGRRFCFLQAAWTETGSFLLSCGLDQNMQINMQRALDSLVNRSAL